jgi:hypothetical protein
MKDGVILSQRSALDLAFFTQRSRVAISDGCFEAALWQYDFQSLPKNRRQDDGLSASLPSIEFGMKIWIDAIKYPQQMDEQGSPAANLDFVHKINDEQ